MFATRRVLIHKLFFYKFHVNLRRFNDYLHIMYSGWSYFKIESVAMKNSQTAVQFN